MYETDTPTLPSLLKDFPILAICPSRVRHGGQFYQSMRVLFSWTQLGPEHEINLRDLVKTLLELMTDVISEGSGEHVFAQSRQGLAH